MRLMTQNSGLKTFSTIIIFILVFHLIGCEAFVKKFTRKQKTEGVQEELVLAPEEYKDTRTGEEKYRHYFEFWKSWQTELYEALLQKKSNKKQVSCANEAIKNLYSMKQMLNQEKQKKLDKYINQMQDVRKLIENDTYGSNCPAYMEKVDSIKMNILRDFSYKKIKDSLL